MINIFEEFYDSLGSICSKKRLKIAQTIHLELF
jgi:hypothetical protein